MSLLGQGPDSFEASNPASGETPGATFESDEPVRVSDEGDSLADDNDAAAVALDEDGSEAPEAVRDPSGLSNNPGV